MTLGNALATQLAQSPNSDSDLRVLAPFRFATSCQNQFVFFLKPEVFAVGAIEQRQAIIELVLERLQTFGVMMTGCAVLSGRFLERVSAMDRHYGFINAMSRGASTQIIGDDAKAVRAAVGADGSVPIIGGHEYLTASGLTPAELDARWQERRSAKVRSGLYVESLDLDGKAFVVVNGFHPAQLAHFTAPGRMIAVALLETDLPWSIIRNRMIGDTFPEKAPRGSIRRELREAAATLGLGSVDITNNCVHLSAGPFEAYFEMGNFLSNIPESGYDHRLPFIATYLRELGLEQDVATVVGNPTSKYGSLFDLTEAVDTRSAVHLYSKLFVNSK